MNKPRLRSRWPLLALLLLGAPVGAADTPLDDPTQPPAGVVGADGSFAASAGFGLTSVFLPKKGRPFAVIDGQLVPLGGSVRGARLTRIAETGVVLEGPGGIERLYLTPDVEKKTTVNRAAVRRNKE
ncbi:MAG TPA: hypothetical protein VFY24_03360 [Azospira sp.]|nr:hypothetical protein [Azospira sp.]